MNVVGYVRVSTEERANHGVSLAAQTEKLRQYAALYDLHLVEVVEDGGFSGKTLGRPGLQHALELLRTGQADGLLVAKLDRLTRSVADLAGLISQYFGADAKVGAKLFSVGDQIDTQTAGGRLVLNVLMSVAQWEREAISERVKTALASKKGQGIRLGAPPLEDPATIGRIVSLRSIGQTFRGIAETLTAEGLATKRGGRWAPETIRKVLARQPELAPC